MLITTNSLKRLSEEQKFHLTPANGNGNGIWGADLSSPAPVSEVNVGANTAVYI